MSIGSDTDRHIMPVLLAGQATRLTDFLTAAVCEPVTDIGHVWGDFDAK